MQNEFDFETFFYIIILYNEYNFLSVLIIACHLDNFDELLKRLDCDHN